MLRNMNYQKFLRYLSGPIINANIILAIALGCMRSEAASDNDPAPAEAANPCSGLFELIEAAKYSKTDKEVLKAGLSVAIPATSTNETIVKHVSQETINTQIKKTQSSYTETLAFISKVAQQIELKSSEYTSKDFFQQLSADDRNVLNEYFVEVVEHYRARSLETLFADYGRTLSLPADMSPSITNAEYRNLLYLAAKTAPPKSKVRLTPGQKFYVLQRGDSLAFVARMHKVSPQAIIAVNPGLVPTRMLPGQVIVIPSIAGVTTTVPALTKETALSSAR